MATDAEQPGDAEQEPDGLTARLSRMALGPARAAARSGRSALTGEAERAVDAVLGGPLPEHVARSLVDHRVVERVLAEWLEAMTAGQEATSPERDRLERALGQALASPALERRLSDAVGSRLTETMAERIVQSPAFRKALSRVLESPEVRSALARQTAGLGEDAAGSVRRWARAVDHAVTGSARRAVGRRPAASESAFGGLAARGIALVLDAVLAYTAFLVAAGSAALITSLAGAFHSTWLTGSLFAAGWTLVVLAYFVLFWSITGQTPGMRVLRLRVVNGSGASPSLWRSLLRFAGLILAIIPMFAGFLPVLFDDRRRALQDYLAGTTVVAER
jgi:uncharacterized RDD family membrane protein YckC